MYICYYCCLNMFQRVLYIKWNFYISRYFLCFKCPSYMYTADAAEASIFDCTRRESNWIYKYGLRPIRIGKYRVYRSRSEVLGIPVERRLKSLVYCSPWKRVFRCWANIGDKDKTSETFINATILYYYHYNVMHKRAPSRINETKNIKSNCTYSILKGNNRNKEIWNDYNMTIRENRCADV